MLILKRETGIEPATSSLDGRRLKTKNLGVHRVHFLPYKSAQFPLPKFACRLTWHKCGTEETRPYSSRLRSTKSLTPEFVSDACLHKTLVEWPGSWHQTITDYAEAGPIHWERLVAEG